MHAECRVPTPKQTQTQTQQDMSKPNVLVGNSAAYVSGLSVVFWQLCQLRCQLCVQVTLTYDAEGCHSGGVHHSLYGCLQPHRARTHLHHRVAACVKGPPGGGGGGQSRGRVKGRETSSSQRKQSREQVRCRCAVCQSILLQQEPVGSCGYCVKPTAVD